MGGSGGGESWNLIDSYVVLCYDDIRKAQFDASLDEGRKGGWSLSHDKAEGANAVVGRGEKSLVIIVTLMIRVTSDLGSDEEKEKMRR